MVAVLSDAVVLASVYILIATGLAMVYGVLRVLHIAHGSVYAAGAFVGYLAYRASGSAVAAFAAAALFASCMGLLIYWAVYRHTIRVSPGVTLVASVGLLVLLEDLLKKPYLAGAYRLPFQVGLPIPSVEWGLFVLTGDQVLIVATTACALAILYLLMKRHRIGMAWRIIAYDPNLAASLGVRVERAIALNFLVGSALAGLAGTLIGIYNGGVAADMGQIPAYKAFVVLVLGGLGSVRGVALAATVLAVVETYIAYFWGFVIPRDAVAFIVMIAVLMFRPEGLFGSAG